MGHLRALGGPEPATEHVRNALQLVRSYREILEEPRPLLVDGQRVLGPVIEAKTLRAVEDRLTRALEQMALGNYGR